MPHGFVTGMDPQDRRTRRRRARWGPEAGDEHDTDAAAQTPQAAPTPQPTAGKSCVKAPALTSARHDVTATCTGVPMLAPVTAFLGAAWPEVNSQLMPGLKHFSRCTFRACHRGEWLLCRGGCRGSGRHIAAGHHCCPVTRCRRRTGRQPQEAARRAHALGTRGYCDSRTFRLLQLSSFGRHALRDTPRGMLSVML
jgi:hypothetical protein